VARNPETHEKDSPDESTRTKKQQVAGAVTELDDSIAPRGQKQL
jgi:hypothetical protein